MSESLIFEAAADPAQADLERYTVTRSGQVLATAVVHEMPEYPEALRVQITADDDQAWAVAATRLAATLRPRAARLLAVARQDQRDAVRLKAAGYRLGWESWGARLHLPPDGLPADAYAELVDGPRAVGFTARELTVPADEALVRQAFELYEASIGDFPRTPATSVDHHDEQSFTAHVARNRLFAAIREDRCVAITVFETGAEKDRVETDFTLVAADRRGLRLASFVKAVAIRQLAAEGVRAFGTGGALVNKPMLRSNEKLGYVLEPLWGSYELALDPDRP